MQKIGTFKEHFVKMMFPFQKKEECCLVILIHKAAQIVNDSFIFLVHYRDILQ